jgi:hypothetical protein
MRIEICPGIIEQAVGLGFEDTVSKALADQSALAVAAVRIETVADHASAVAYRVGNDSYEARRHLRKIDIGVADRRRDWFRHLTYFHDTNRHEISCSAFRAADCIYRRISKASPRRTSRFADR